MTTGFFIGPAPEDVERMYDEMFEPVRFGNVRLSALAGIWSEYAINNGLNRGSVTKLNGLFLSIARSRNKQARRYGYACITGVRRKQ